ncbi:hypothetical protein [Falsiroseomonas sp. CW058]|uniref:hypothetical protein n=1 Tax=Falsiroseomonas sp. CW058 TaxID=3388664 RepID=UPI003D311B5F
MDEVLKSHILDLAAEASIRATEGKGDADPYENSDPFRERLLDEMWRLMHSFEGNAFRDGRVRDRIAEIDRTLVERD